MENNMGREECIIEVNEEDWVRQMEEEFKEEKQGEFKRWKDMSIYRVPLSLKKLSEKAYRPQVVAIGPYHHGEEQLEGMEEHKKRALRVFLERSNKPLDEYVNALTPILQDLKNAYQQLQPKLKCGDFLRMMVIDGCFILELLRTKELDFTRYAPNDPVFSKYGLIYFGPHLKRDMLMLENQIPLSVLNALVEVAGKDTYNPDVTDCILKFFERTDESSSNNKFINSLHILDVYRRSLLSFKRNGSNGSGGRRCTDIVRGMYGNCIKSINKNKNDEKDRKSWIRHCVNKISFGGGMLRPMPMSVDDANKKKNNDEECLKKKKTDEEEYHMRPATDLAEAEIQCEKGVDKISFDGGKARPPSISVDDASKKKKKKKKNYEYHMRSATDLAEAGIQCVIGDSPYVDQISFHKGKLMLPPISVDDATKTIYLNMMAFEWFNVNRCLKEGDKDNYNEGFHVTAYVFFMDRLIDTAKDVSLLHKHHIMQYSVGSDQSVAEIFNTLSTDICIDPKNKLEELQQEVAKYYRKPMPGCIAYAKRTYFANTWVTLSIVAAIFLFALAITQTVYAVLDYHKSDAPAPAPAPRLP